MLKTGNYCISAENILAHELIGLKVKVLESPDHSKKGLGGKVVDETRNLLCIERRGEVKRIPKHEAVFGFELGKETAVVDGSKIMQRPENRLKVFWRGKNA